jgi:hypothetical protein
MGDVSGRRRVIVVLLGLALTGAQGCFLPRPRVTSDAEIAAKGAWTATDTTARRLLDQEGLSPDAFPLRRETLADEMMVEVGSDAHPVLIPSPSRTLGALLGFDQVHRYRYLETGRGYILFHPDRPPTLIADDPDHPPPTPRAGDAPAVAFRELSERIERELHGVPPVTIER